MQPAIRRHPDAPPAWHPRCEDLGYVPGDLVDGDDGYYDGPSEVSLGLRIVAWLVSVAFAAAIGTVVLKAILNAFEKP
jgi:hypothetical protein